jgi:hypothetical protein
MVAYCTEKYMYVAPSQHYFHPISSSKLGTNGSLSSSVACSNPVVLQVTNLDQNIDAKELKRTLLSVFREHVMVC